MVPKVQVFLLNMGCNCASHHRFFEYIQPSTMIIYYAHDILNCCRLKMDLTIT